MRPRPNRGAESFPDPVLQLGLEAGADAAARACLRLGIPRGLFLAFDSFDPRGPYQSAMTVNLGRDGVLPDDTTLRLLTKAVFAALVSGCGEEQARAAFRYALGEAEIYSPDPAALSN